MQLVVAPMTHEQVVKITEDEIGKLVRNVIRPLEAKVAKLEAEVERLTITARAS